MLEDWNFGVLVINSIPCVFVCVRAYVCLYVYALVMHMPAFSLPRSAPPPKKKLNPISFGKLKNMISIKKMPIIIISGYYMSAFQILIYFLPTKAMYNTKNCKSNKSIYIYIPLLLIKY